MKYFIVHLAIFALSLAPVVVFAQASVSNHGQVQELYTKGKKAFEEEDFVAALKYLYAFKIISGEEFSKSPKFAAQIDERIRLSELQLRNALTAARIPSGPSSRGSGSSR